MDERLQERIQEAVSKDPRLSRMVTISDVIIDQEINTNTIKINIEYISNLNGNKDAVQIGIGNINDRGPAPYEQVNNK